MLTFSYNDLNNQSIYYTNNSDIDSVLSNLPNNSNNLINPKDIRDAIYTNYVSNIFKETNISGIKYIGLDNDKAAILVKEPFYFGKRQLNGNDIMNSTLLTNGTDIFFFNNNSDSSTQSTTLTILAGSSSLLYNNAPYIQSYPYINTIDLNIINNNGNINIISSSSSYVSINNINFPNITASVGNSLVIGSVSNNNYYLTWKDTTSSVVYTNSTPMPSNFQGYTTGKTFSNTLITDIITNILYPYTTPTIILSASYSYYNYNNGSYYLNQITNGYNNTIEYGTKNTNIYDISYIASLVSQGGTITSPDGSTRTSIINPSIIDTKHLTFSSTNFTYIFNINDGKSSINNSISLSYAYPIWYGVLGLGSIYNSIFSNSFVTESNIISASFSSARYSLNYSLSGSTFTITPQINGCLMIMFPSSLGNSIIVTPKGTSQFTNNTFGYYSLTFSNYTYWSGIQYCVYYYHGGSINNINGKYYTTTFNNTYTIQIGNNLPIT